MPPSFYLLRLIYYFTIIFAISGNINVRNNIDFLNEINIFYFSVNIPIISCSKCSIKFNFICPENGS